jgi:hypothetical protein
MIHRPFNTPRRPASSDPNRPVPNRRASTARAATARMILAAIAIFIAAGAPSLGASPAQATGAPPDCHSKHSTKFRWPQKTLQDKRAASIHSNPVHVVTIAGLSQLSPPKPLGPKTPRHG